jgi:hypothetical protein
MAENRHPAIEPDDTEGHAAISHRLDADQDDTEGHMPRIRGGGVHDEPAEDAHGDDTDPAPGRSGRSTR